MANVKKLPPLNTKIRGSNPTGKDFHWGDAFDFDANGRPVLNVHDMGPHTELVNRHFSLDLGNTDLVASAILPGDSIIGVTDSTKFSAGNKIVIKEGPLEDSNTIKVIASSGAPLHQLTLDRPMERAYTTAAIVHEVATDVSLANGTIASPVIYQIAPPAGEVWHILTISVVAVDGTAPAVELFSGISALTNGLLLRQELARPRNLVNIKSNGDFHEYFGGSEIDIQQKSGGGDWALSGLWHIKEHLESIVRLDGDAGDTLDLVIQDNLTDITELEFLAQGHVEI